MSVEMQIGTVTVKRGLAQMLKGGVIMDVVTPEQALVAQEAGAVAVMALEKIPADIRRDGGVARMSHPALIKRIMDAVTIPGDGQGPHRSYGGGASARSARRRLYRRVRSSHAGDDKYHIDKHAYNVPYVCGAKDLGEALRRIAEGAAMIRSKGEAGAGISSRPCVTCARSATRSLNFQRYPKKELVTRARDLGAPLDLVQYVAEHKKLPVVLSAPAAWRPQPTLP